MHCIVIGAGIIGTCTALRLAQSGAQVTLLETSLPGDGTTSTTFAWVNASGKRPREYFELNVAGIQAHRRFLAEWTSTPWLVPTGSLRWETAPESQERLIKGVEELRDWGYSATLLSPGQVTRDLEPDLLIDPAVEAVAFYPDESHIYPRQFLTNLLRAGQALGVELHTHTRVVDFDIRSNRVQGVILESGTKLQADIVVCCCGRWTSEVVQLAGVNLPLISPDPPASPAVGLLIVTSGVCADIRRVVHTPDIGMRPDGSNRLLLNAEDLDRASTLHTPLFPPSQAAEEVLERAGQYVQHMASARIEFIIRGIRPIPQDGFPAVGWAKNLEGLYMIVTHSGVTLGPALAEMATREIYGTPEKLLAPFRPERFWIAQEGTA